MKRFTQGLTVMALAGFCLLAASTQAAVQGTLPATNPAAAATQNDIRDIRPPYHIPPGWLWLAWAGGAVALAGASYGVWRWSRNQVVAKKLPYELALEKLLAARRFMQPEQARAFSFAVSEAVRNYIEITFAVRAAHHTTPEFLRDLLARQNSPLAAHREVLEDFLRHCDLAKFARWILSEAQMEAMLQSAITFVTVTAHAAAETSPAENQPTPEPQLAPVHH